MNALDFLSPSLAAPDARWASPLARALAEAPAGFEDVSLSGKLEVRGALNELDAFGAELVRISPDRAVLFCEPEQTAALAERLVGALRIYDVSAAYAGVRVRGAQLLRRVTDLDLDELPAVGALAHVQALVVADGDETFRVYVPQEYGHYVAEVLIDAARGLTG
jgi:sarcosine oxidase gamma subunit